MSGIQITKALYGTGSTTVDVTKAVSSHIKDGTLNLTVTPDSLNVTDPAPNQQKTLDVTYTINGGSSMGQMIKDNEVLLIAAPPAREATGLEITKAEYGYPGNFTDVTSALQAQVKDGSINIKVGPSTVGIPDPNPNKQKTLEVQYTINGAQNVQSVTDGKMFTVYAPAVDAPDNLSPKQHVTSLMTSIWSSLFYATGVFLYVVSIFVCYRYFQGIIGGALGFFLPYFAFWGLPIYVFARRLFSQTDFAFTLPTLPTQ
jgi:hypothetical protein